MTPISEQKKQGSSPKGHTKISAAHVLDFANTACQRLDDVIARLPQPTADRFPRGHDPIEEPTENEMIIALLLLVFFCLVI